MLWSMAHLQELLAARYAGQPAPTLPPADTNAVLQTLLSHRSVRAFAPDALPDGTLELLVAAAQSAPSSSNLQVWSLIAVQDPARKQRLSLLAGDQVHIREAPLFLAFLVDTARLSDLAARAGGPAEGLEFLDTFLMGAIDAALAAQNALVAAESLGLGTVYIGALRNRPEEVAQELGLTPGLFAVFGLCVGRPDPARPAAVKPRLAQENVLFHEQYQRRTGRPDVSDYDAAMRTFYESQRQPVVDWSQHSLERVRGPEALRGRDRLRAALSALGFPLR